MSGLLHNCEAFGNAIPKDLEHTYMKLLKSCFDVRSNVPNDILLIESGLAPLKALILFRQHNFYKRFMRSIKPGSRREKMMTILVNEKTSYLQHYENLITNYTTSADIFIDHVNILKRKIQRLADNGQYKYQIYRSNRNLNPHHSLTLCILWLVT